MFTLHNIMFVFVLHKNIVKYDETKEMNTYVSKLLKNVIVNIYNVYRMKKVKNTKRTFMYYFIRSYLNNKLLIRPVLIHNIIA